MTETLEANVVRRMRRLNRVYAQCSNCRHHGVGHIFEARHEAVIVQKKAYLLELAL